MEEIISKELLSEVLNINFDWLQNIKLEGSILTYEKYYESFRGDSCSYWSDEEINIYELAFKKCVRWALNKGYNLTIRPSVITISQQLDLLYYKHEIINIDKDNIPYNPNDVFKACEWILNQKATHG